VLAARNGRIVVIAQREHVPLAAPPLTVGTLRETARALRSAASDLRTLGLSERIAALDHVAAAWLAPDSPWRWRALVEVFAATGYPEPTIEVALDNLWTALRAPHLAEVARSEDLERLAGATPRLALHVLAGNVPGSGVFGIVGALLAGVPSLVKPAAREPHVASLVVESIASLAPAFRGAIAVASWRGGTAELDAAALEEADLVLAYGRDETLDALAGHAHYRLLRFGQRVSVALLARSAATRRTAAALAEQVALFDQQGCLSVQVACVEESSPEETRDFAAMVADELARLAGELPRAPLVLAESIAVQRFLERQRWRAQEGEPVEVHGGEAGRFSVVCDRTADWPRSPGFRHLVVLPVATMTAAGSRLAPLAGVVEALGYAGPADRLGEVATVAAECGAHRLCPLERMQAPPFAWRQSGYTRLASLFRDDIAACCGDPLAPFA
jgi:hypothetical protein